MGSAPTYNSSVVISELEAHATSSFPTLLPSDTLTNLLPAFELQAQKSISAPLPLMPTASSIVSPTRKPGKRCYNSLDKNPGSPKASPLSKRKAASSKKGPTSPDSPPEIIFVMSSVNSSPASTPQSMVSITRYTTPQTPEPITKRPVVADVSPMKDSDSDDNILHTIKQEKMVIDLCTPEKQVQKAGAAINKKPIKTESVIDLCSPVKPMLVSQGVKPESPPAKIVKASCSAIDTFSVYQSIDEAEAAIY